MLDAIAGFHRHMERTGTIIGFSGTFSQGINEEVCEALEFYVAHRTNEKKQMSRLFSVFIEMSQNIRKYFSRKQEWPDVYSRINNSGAIVIGTTGRQFYVSSVNLVETKDLESLSRRLDPILQLNQEELKDLYLQMLKSHQDPGPGAGLGFIDLARKTAGHLTYRTEKLDDAYSYFYLDALLPENKCE